jgi:hypothetical protein
MIHSHNNSGAVYFFIVYFRFSLLCLLRNISIFQNGIKCFPEPHFNLNNSAVRTKSVREGGIRSIKVSETCIRMPPSRSPLFLVTEYLNLYEILADTFSNKVSTEIG